MTYLARLNGMEPFRSKLFGFCVLTTKKNNQKCMWLLIAEIKLTEQL